MVMFRDFTTRRSRRFGLLGEVQNLKDGSVKVIAEGEEESLKKLIVELHKGSLLSRVQKIDVAWTEPEGNYQKFSITY